MREIGVTRYELRDKLYELSRTRELSYRLRVTELGATIRVVSS